MGGNIGMPILARAARERSRLRHRNVVLPDRPDAFARSVDAACCSISRPIISIATARWTITRRQGTADRASADARRRRRRHLRRCDRRAGLEARRPTTLTPVSAAHALGRGFVAEGARRSIARPAHGPEPSRRSRRLRVACAARTMRRTRLPPSRRSASGRSIARDDRGRAVDLSRALRIAWRRSDGVGACCSSTIPRRPMRTRPKRRCGRSTTFYWIIGGVPKEGGIEPLAPAVHAHRQGLPDRRGGGRFRRARSAPSPFEQCGTLDARCRVSRARRSGERGRTTGRAAVAGLRVLRSICEFRAARRRVSHCSCASTFWPKPGADHDIARRPIRCFPTGAGRSTAGCSPRSRC